MKNLLIIANKTSSNNTAVKHYSNRLAAKIKGKLMGNTAKTVLSRLHTDIIALKP